MQLCVYQKKDGLTPLCLSAGAEKQVFAELCELNGKTYVSIKKESIDDIKKEIPDLVEVDGKTFGKSLQKIVSKIKAEAPAVKEIRERVIEKIRKRYSVDDEIYLLRTAPSPEAVEWNDFVEECRQWGREQKAALGL